MDWRRRNGLRWVEPWVRIVTAAPEAAPVTAANPYAYPLWPDEVRTLRERERSIPDVGTLAEAYGADHPDDWAGVLVDEQGRLVLQFARNVDGHRTAVLALVGEQTGFELGIRHVRWSLAELELFHERLLVDQRWLYAVGGRRQSSSVDVGANKVFAWISSSDQDAPHKIKNWLGATGWLEVFSDGIGPWLGPTGHFVVTIFGTDGRPYRRLDELRCNIVPADPAAYRVGDVSPSPEGECRSLDGVGAVAFTVRLFRASDPRQVAIAEGRLVVPPGGIGRLTLVVRD